MARSITKDRPAATYLGDLVRAEFHRMYCCVEGPIKNPSSSDDLEGFNPLGQPLKLVASTYQFVLSTDEGNATAICFHDKPINLAHGVTSSDRYLILKRGPAVIDLDALPTDDIEGTAFDTVAELAAAYAALSPPIITVRALTPTKTQEV